MFCISQKVYLANTCLIYQELYIVVQVRVSMCMCLISQIISAQYSRVYSLPKLGLVILNGIEVIKAEKRSVFNKKRSVFIRERVSHKGHLNKQKTLLSAESDHHIMSLVLQGQSIYQECKQLIIKITLCFKFEVLRTYQQTKQV